MTVITTLALLASAPSGAAVGEPGASSPRSAGSLQLQGAGGAWVDAVTLNTRLDVSIAGLLADITLVQRFRNDSNQWRDARYLLPMPEQAVLRGMHIRVGDRYVRGTVQPIAEAEATFAAASQSGQVASIVAAERPNLFSTRLANIAPGDTIAVTLDLLVPVTVTDAHLQLALPTTLTPRYVNAAVADPDAVLGSIVQPTIGAGPVVELSVRRADAGEVDSASVALRRHGDAYEWRGPGDRDVLLEWPLDGAGGLSTATHAGTRYAQLLLSPPAPSSRTLARQATPPGELVLVLDRSGSMAGEPIRAARAAINAALDRLAPTDTFNIIAFDDQPDSLFAKSRAGSADNIARARAWVKHIDADGGTEIAPALQRALASSAAGADTRIVFITDGSIGYEDALLERIDASLQGRRLFTIGIGAAPNRWFLQQAARLGRGEALFIADASNVMASIERLLVSLRSPVLTNLSIGVEGGSARFYPDPLPDLYAGRPVMVVAQLQGDVQALVLTGTVGEQRSVVRHALPASPARVANATRDIADNGVANESAAGLAVHWASRRIAHLEDAQRGAADPQRHRDEITALSLEIGIASRYTRFVAVEEHRSRPDGQRAVPSEVANLMPAGAHMQSVLLPQGALGLRSLRWLALASLLLATALLSVRRRLGA